MTGGLDIACKGLSKAFGSNQVLSSLDLEIRRGETLVILGHSGSGKSVLLKHLNGLISPDAGSVMVDSTDIAQLAESALFEIRLNLGMLFQGGALFDSLTIGQNIRFPLDQHSVGTSEDREERVAELLRLVGLDGTQEQMPDELSGGMRKRAALARALALQPLGMLYDEPTTGLDPVTAHQINVLIRDTQARFGLTSVVVTHDIASATYVADRIAFLYDGKILAVGSVEEMSTSEHPTIREFLSAGPAPVKGT